MSTSLNLLAASALAVTLIFAAAPQVTHAAQATKASSSTTTPTKKHTPQQQRMADCSHQAKTEGKKGTERKAFMSTCLKGSHTAAADTSTQHKTKMKTQPKAAAEG
ncbi:MAG: PsiF family protein [Rhodanobacter sp.]